MDLFSLEDYFHSRDINVYIKDWKTVYIAGTFEEAFLKYECAFAGEIVGHVVNEKNFYLC